MDKSSPITGYLYIQKPTPAPAPTPAPIPVVSSPTLVPTPVPTPNSNNSAPINADKSKITPLLGKWSINGDPLNSSFEITAIEYNDAGGYFGKGSNVTCMDASFTNSIQTTMGIKAPLYDYHCTINGTSYSINVKGNEIEGRYCRAPE